MKNILFLLSGLCTGMIGWSQSFPGPVGDASTTAVFKDDGRVDYWLADSVLITRGYRDISDQSIGLASYGDNEYALGASDPNVVSLGDGGSAIYVLSQPIFDREGYDFAVFENAFDDYFLELAFVEVSTDGINYVRFQNQSNVDTDTQTGSFGATYTENIHNLAGKYRAQYGTPFDLNELADSIDVDITNINYIKIIDVVGSINTSYASYDSYGNMINDPWPTPFNSSGFDLDAVAILKPVQLTINEWASNLIFAENKLVVEQNDLNLTVSIFDVSGRLVLTEPLYHTLDLNHLQKGVYVVQVTDQTHTSNLKIKVD